ncbi:MAG TPA: DUF996 domain-containing protein [Nitrososphaerales archaeon]|nr:DUF996 domain-containing protein [Nitrososphaerales archaeon]
MTSLSDARALGGVGSILVLLTVVPSVGWILGIAGLVMTLISIKYISDSVRDNRIYSNMLVSVVLAIGAIAVGTVAVIGTVFRVLGMGSFVGSEFIPAANVTTGDWVGLGVAIAAGLVAVWALLVASAVFLRRSYNSIAARVNVNLFSTAGLLYLIGAATAIIGIGFFLILVAQILLAVSFFSIKEGGVTQAVQAAGVPASA